MTVKAAKICVQFTEIPAIALVPVAIVWFGIGEGSKYFVVSYTVFLTVWFNTHHGMQYVPETYLRASRTLGASRLREFLTVESIAKLDRRLEALGKLLEGLGRRGEMNF